MSYLSHLFGYHVTCWPIWLLCELGYTVYLVCRTCLLYSAYHWSVRIYSVKHLICALSDCAALSLISRLMPLCGFYLVPDSGFLKLPCSSLQWITQQVRLTCLAMFFMLNLPLQPLFFRLFFFEGKTVGEIPTVLKTF